METTYGAYTLLAKLATGGMAQVFLARQSGLEGFERLVVLKRILPHLAENEEFVRMFLQEARVAARLSHPGIAQIFDLGKVGDSFFIAMEYIHGEDFRRIVRQAAAESRTLPIPLACRMVIGACEGLEYAHSKPDDQGKPLNIVHRDVSPQNLLATFEGQVKVIDFGIAKAADSANHTRTGVLKGKYSYMSPEQAEGRRVDRRSDVFALGTVLYELVTQQRLFKRGNDLATVQAVMTCKVPPPSAVNPSIDPDLDRLILRVLTRDRDERTQTAGQLALELEEYLLRHRLPGSTAHLRQFLRELYSERLEKEKALGRPAYESDAAASVAARATPSGSSFEFDRDPPKPPAAPVDAPDDDPTSDSRKRPSPIAPSPPSQPKLPTLTGTDTEKVQSPASSVTLAASSSKGIVLAPRPHRPPPLAGPPPLSPSVADGSQGEISSRIRVGRQRGALGRVVAALLLVGLAVAAVAWLRPDLFSLAAPAQSAKLLLKSEPPGAEIFLDGASAGRTPLELAVDGARPHELRLARDGYASLTETVAPFEGSDSRSFRLERRDVGALKVETTPPGAAIVLDGHQLGRKTPALLTDLEPGRDFELVLTLAGYLDEVVQQKVRAGKVTTLQRAFKPVSERAVTTTAKPPDLQEPPREPTPTSTGSREGTLSLTTQPAGLAVEIDGKPAGTTPLQNVKLPPGKHEIRFLDADRFLDQRAVALVVAGESARLDRVFAARQVRFNVTPYAKVYIRDREFADSPGDAELVPGTYRVTYSCPEIRARRTETLTVPPGGEPFKVQFVLRENEGDQ